MIDVNKKAVKLQILQETVFLVIEAKDEEMVRMAAKKLNDRAVEMKARNPSLRTPTLFACLALWSMLESDKEKEIFSDDEPDTGV